MTRSTRSFHRSLSLSLASLILCLIVCAPAHGQAKDLVSFDGPQRVVATKRQGYSGGFLFKRSGIHYYLYTLGAYENYEYAYMMSRVFAARTVDSARR
jgi:hypothetical protein